MPMKIAAPFVLLGCFLSWQVLAAPADVCKIDTAGVRDVQPLANEVSQIANAVYPQILAVLGAEKADVPRQFEVVFREHLIGSGSGPGDEALGWTSRKTIVLNAGFLREHLDFLAPVIVHEMAHVAENYPFFRYNMLQAFAYTVGFKAAHPLAPFPQFPIYWTEGLAAYTCAKLGYTNAD